MLISNSNSIATFTFWVMDTYNMTYEMFVYKHTEKTEYVKKYPNF